MDDRCRSVELVSPLSSVSFCWQDNLNGVQLLSMYFRDEGNEDKIHELLELAIQNIQEKPYLLEMVSGWGSWNVLRSAFMNRI